MRINPDPLIEDVTAHADHHYRELDGVDRATADGVRQTLREWVSGVLRMIEQGNDRIAIAEMEVVCPILGCEERIPRRSD